LPRRRHTGLSRLLPYALGKRGRLAVIAVLSAVSAAAPVAGWHLVGDAIDNGVGAGDERRLAIVVIAYIAVNAAAWILGTATWLLLADIGQRVVLEVRRDLFDHLTSLSLRYFSQQKAGWIIARLTSDVDALSDVLNQGLNTLVWNTLTLVAAVAGLFLLDWRLGLVALCVLPPGILVTRWFQRRSHAAFAEVRTRIAAVTAQLAESVSGMAVIQAFNRERAFQAEFAGLNESNRRANVVAQKLSSVFFPAIELLGVLAMGAVLYAGAQFIGAGSMQIGTLVAGVGLLNLVFQPLQELSELYGQVQAANAAMDKISSVLDAEIDVADAPHARPLGRVDGLLELDRVTFAYGDEPVLHAIELAVPVGGCIALVGESGGGKSTLAKLIARFYDPDEGAVRVDGTDLRDVELRSYRRQLGVVLQDPFLFSGTIADNIRFAKPDASDEEVEAAAAAIGVDRVAARLEGGLQHVVREGGAGLSAGERQLISIARALVADPRILILDEATSNIDRPSEILIERAFDRLLAGRTSIIIAHRLATVRAGGPVPPPRPRALRRHAAGD
jgi:ATP-binding cassette subfamily B protein